MRELAILGGQVVVVIVLGVLVGLGHNSYIQDALLAVCGSIAGIGLYDRFKTKAAAPVE